MAGRRLSAYDRAISELRDVLGEYDRIEVSIHRVVSGWQRLDPEARRMVAGLAPELVDAVLAVEAQSKRLVDVA